MIIWADNDEDQVGLHANFKLSASGETIVLSDASGTTLDQVTYFSQTSDLSFGRTPNGTGNFFGMSPTFDASNSFATSIDEVQETLLLTVYPNPSSDFFRLKITEDIPKLREVHVYDLQGNLILSETVSDRLLVNTSGWAAGMYLVKVDHAFLKISVL